MNFDNRLLSRENNKNERTKPFNENRKVEVPNSTDSIENQEKLDDIADVSSEDMHLEMRDLSKQEISKTKQGLDDVRKKMGIEESPEDVPSIKMARESIKTVEENLNKVGKGNSSGSVFANKADKQDGLNTMSPLAEKYGIQKHESSKEGGELDALYEKLKNHYSRTIDLSESLTPEERYKKIFNEDKFSKEDEEILKKIDEARLDELLYLRRNLFVGNEKPSKASGKYERSDYYYYHSPKDILTDINRANQYWRMNG